MSGQTEPMSDQTACWSNIMSQQVNKILSDVTCTMYMRRFTNVQHVGAALLITVIPFICILTDCGLNNMYMYMYIRTRVLT